VSTIPTSILILVGLFGAALLGMLLRRVLPENHLNADTKDVVKMSMGLVATMAALVLGLLVASAKDKYDKEAAGVTQMAAKIIFLDRVLANFGSESESARGVLRTMVERVKTRMWPDETAAQADLDPTTSRTEAVYAEIQNLKPGNDLQTALKSQAQSSAIEIGQLRWQEFEESSSTVSLPLLLILTFWLAILFVSFGMFAPSNSTATISLLMAAMAVSGAIFMMMELNSPFSGVLQVSSAPFNDALVHLGK
jgi:hypothetical protein